MHTAPQVLQRLQWSDVDEDEEVVWAWVLENFEDGKLVQREWWWQSESPKRQLVKASY